MTRFIKVTLDHNTKPLHVNIDQIVDYKDQMICFNDDENYIKVVESADKITALINANTPSACVGDCSGLRDNYLEMMDSICSLCKQVNPQHKNCTSCPEMDGFHKALAGSPCKGGDRALADAVERYLNSGKLSSDYIPSFENLQATYNAYRKVGE